MALYRLICALGRHSLVSVLLKCHLPLPAYILADEKHGKCLAERVYLPTIVSGRVIWLLGYSESKSAAAFTESYGQFQRGALIDSFDSTTKSMRTLFPGARLGYCLRHALKNFWISWWAWPPRCAKGGARSFTRCYTAAASAKAYEWCPLASDCADLWTRSRRRKARNTASECATG